MEFNIISDLFDGLVSVSPAGEIQPRLAAKWDNKDNTVWTFHLRPGVTWSDGTAITAQDIVWSWQRAGFPGYGITLCQLSGKYAYCECAGYRAG
ncbi:Periplasmic oligopeptide-binding protein precursor [Raoultella terrigena]|uniref:Periplasmic oligopeptide-binding protein n=1 Tax=Raoultella terrigena TaxID=577 RepID=A0A4V6J2U9_RAOTE|nr:Periplasmic oligopeptide-binding protein precursor [Raoultella terrigena]